MRKDNTYRLIWLARNAKMATRLRPVLPSAEFLDYGGCERFVQFSRDEPTLMDFAIRLVRPLVIGQSGLGDDGVVIYCYARHGTEEVQHG